MDKKKLLILLLTISLCFPALIFAETIVLKSGKIVGGKIIEKTDKYIKIDRYGVPITYFFDEIDTIDGINLHKNTNELKEATNLTNNKFNEETSLSNRNIYNNSKYGVSLLIPEGWFVDDNARSEFNGTTLLIAYKNNPQVKVEYPVIKLVRTETRTDLSFLKQGNKLLTALPGVNIIEPDREVNINGIDCLRGTIERKGKIGMIVESVCHCRAKDAMYGIYFIGTQDDFKIHSQDFERVINSFNAK